MSQYHLPTCWIGNEIMSWITAFTKGSSLWYISFRVMRSWSFSKFVKFLLQKKEKNVNSNRKSQSSWLTADKICTSRKNAPHIELEIWGFAFVWSLIAVVFVSAWININIDADKFTLAVCVCVYSIWNSKFQNIHTHNKGWRRQAFYRWRALYCTHRVREIHEADSNFDCWIQNQRCMSISLEPKNLMNLMDNYIIITRLNTIEWAKKFFCCFQLS